MSQQAVATAPATAEDKFKAQWRALTKQSGATSRLVHDLKRITSAVQIIVDQIMVDGLIDDREGLELRLEQIDALQRVIAEKFEVLVEHVDANPPGTVED